MTIENADNRLERVETALSSEGLTREEVSRLWFEPIASELPPGADPSIIPGVPLGEHLQELKEFNMLVGTDERLWCLYPYIKTAPVIRGLLEEEVSIENIVVIENLEDLQKLGETKSPLLILGDHTRQELIKKGRERAANLLREVEDEQREKAQAP